MTTLRSKIIHLAHQTPSLRAHLLPLLKTAEEFDTQDAMDKYLKKHPGANKSNHSVKKTEKKEPSKSEGGSAEHHVDLAHLPDDAKVKDLPPEAREEISEYKLSVVGDSAKSALEVSRKLKKGIDRAADICKMSPSVCKSNKGLTRDKMPQIEGEKSVKAMLASSKPDEVAKGKAMVEAGADPKSDKTVLDEMISHLSENGIKTTKKKMPVGKMKATQSEIKAEKVFGMADAHLKGKFDGIGDSVVVSKDGHILDGHHRWAALLTIDPGREMDVREIDMTMDELLKEAASYPGVYKADFAGKPLAEDEQKKYKSENKSKYKKDADKKSSLYGSVVRLAHANPKLRPLLLPLLRDTRS